MALYNSMGRPFQMGVASVRPYVDRVVLFDGSWDGRASTDGTLEYITQWSHRDPMLELCTGGWVDELGKRQMQINWGEKDDWVFFIDSDEVLEFGGGWLRQVERGDWLRPEMRVPTDVVIRDTNGRSYFRKNLFPAFESFGTPSGMKLPIVLRHDRLEGGLA